MATKRRARSKKPPTSPSVDDFGSELAHGGDRADLVRRIARLWQHLGTFGLDEADRKLIEIGRAAKKNFAQRFSNSIAQKTADALRGDLRDISPDAEGRGHESLSAGARGLKKLDVNYSTPRSGLELAVSIKTINFKDEVTGRYTKNTKRVDGELRAEAQDCHTRQPFAVLAAYLFLPEDAANDGKQGPSSLKHNVQVLARRAGRQATGDDPSLFELVFVGLYRDDGHVVFFPADDEVPDDGAPSVVFTFSETLEQVRQLHAARNRH